MTLKAQDTAAAASMKVSEGGHLDGPSELPIASPPSDAAVIAK